VPIVLKSGSLKLLEPSRLVQACNGTAFPYSILMGLFLLQVSDVAGLIGAGACNYSDRTLTEIMNFKTNCNNLLNLLLHC